MKYFWLNTLRKADEVLLANVLFLEFLNREVVQLVRMLVLGTSGRGFESLLPY